MALYEQLMTKAIAVLVRPAEGGESWYELIDPRMIRPLGFGPQHALIPFRYSSFDGYRLLTEYFLFRERFLFADIGGLGALRRVTESEVDVIVLFETAAWGLSNSVTAQNLCLYCTPAANLFPRRVDPIRVDRRRPEHHIVPDRTRPLDFEVFRVDRVLGLNSDGGEREFFPFYSLVDHSNDDERAYFAIRRTPRVLSSRQKKFGTRSSYLGSEAFISLVDRKTAPYSADLHVLAIDALCTNRDLPLQMPVGQGDTDFNLASGAPISSIRCITGPTRPQPSLAHARRGNDLEVD